MTSLDVRLLPIFDDNYVFFITRPESKTCVVVDPGDAAPVQDYLEKHGLTLQAILLTHHHNDHIGGALELKQRWNVPVYAPLKNQAQIPFATDYLSEGQRVSLLDGQFNLEVLELPGHTLGHIAFFERERKWLFSGDILFGLGCGRLFEGTFEQGFETMQRVKALPDETLVYCTHEYTEANLRFCKRLPAFADLKSYEDTLVSKRRAGQPSVPLKLDTEKAVNPFLLAADVERFTELRKLRNQA
ncbi:MAG: hydroxyacylglutathione hydrolase [Bdellovibrio sp.]|nr:hydroxyacylglutathione hydrolase [Bdellovibrio sp.]